MNEKAVINQSDKFSSQKNKSVKPGKNQKYNRRFSIMLVALPLFLFVTIIVAVALGPVIIHPLTVWEIILSNIPFLDQFSSGEWTNAEQNIAWEIRLPRVLLGVIVGAGLSLAGTGIQALVRNSLADPYILGVSSGASVGALLSVILVFYLGQVNGRISTTRLLLSGIALSMILSAVTDFIVISAPDDDKIHSALFWMMGSLAGANWSGLPIAAIAVVA